MQEISTNPKTHVIITWKDGEYFITGKQHEVVLNIGLNDKITIDGNTIYGKSISEVITVEEKNRRDNQVKSVAPDYYQNYTGVDKTLENLTPERRRKALDKIHKAFIKHFEGRALPVGGNMILKNMEFKMGTQDW